MILIALNTALALTPGRVHFTVAHTRFTPLDVVGIAIAAVMVVLLLVRAARNLRELAALEPAASRRGAARRPSPKPTVRAAGPTPRRAQPR